MFAIKRAILLSLCIINPLIAMGQDSEVNLVLTTALVTPENPARIAEYIASFKQFRDLGYDKPYIVEGVQPAGPSFLEEYTDPNRVYYYPDNRPADKNRGKFEGLSLRGALTQFDLNNDSYVYKQTGRYFATKDLAAIIKEHPGFEVYIRRFAGMERIVLSAFIMNAQAMQEMYNNLDYDAMEREWTPEDPERHWIENYITAYLKQAEQEGRFEVHYLPSGADDFPLGITINPGNSTTGVNPNSSTRY